LIGETPTRLGNELARHAIGLQVAAACLGCAAGPALIGILARRFRLETVLGPAILAYTIVMLALHEWAILTNVRRAGTTQAPEHARRQENIEPSGLAQVGVDEAG